MKTDEAGIVISGRSWSASDFVRADGTPGPWTSKALEADPLSFEAELGRFLTEFFSPGAAVTVHTSGSTGAPKAFAAEKSRMRASARATIAFLGLKPGCTNLLAMPLRFIAGKMVVVRSVECGLNLIPVEPCANPFLEHREAVDLCALTPMQAATVLANPATSRFLLESRAVILGGGPVDEELTAKLQSVQMLSISSTAPLQIKQRSLEAVSSTSTDTRRRTKSKGSSSSFIKRSRTVRSK